MLEKKTHFKRRGSDIASYGIVRSMVGKKIRQNPVGKKLVSDCRTKNNGNDYNRHMSHRKRNLFAFHFTG